MIRSVLFICSGNTCRSPMAAELLRWRIDGHPEIRSLKVESAGTNVTGVGPAKHAVTVMRDDYARDIASHQPRQLSEEHARYDLLLAMDTGVEHAARDLLPGARVERLGDFVAANVNVTDPYCQPLDEYRACAQQIDSMIQEVVLRLAGAQL